VLTNTLTLTNNSIPKNWLRELDLNKQNALRILLSAEPDKPALIYILTKIFNLVAGAGFEPTTFAFY